MNQTNRPDQIDMILDKINTQMPDDMGATLETYIVKLEAHQTVDDETFVWDSDDPPIWSHARHKKRMQRFRQRAARKHNNYSGLKQL